MTGVNKFYEFAAGVQAVMMRAFGVMRSCAAGGSGREGISQVFGVIAVNKF